MQNSNETDLVIKEIDNLWIDSLSKVIDEQVSLLNVFITIFVKKTIHIDGEVHKTIEGETLNNVLPLMLQSLGSTVVWTQKLAADLDLSTRHAYPLLRSLIETTINILFIISIGEEGAKKMSRHSIQKFFREVDKNISVRKLAMSGQRKNFSFDKKSILESDLELTPDIREIVAEFTSKKGREKNWTDENVDDKLKHLEQCYGSSCISGIRFAHQSIYSISSEIIHGTYYASEYFWGYPGLFGMPRTQEEQGNLFANHCIHIMLCTVQSMQSLLEVCAIILDSNYFRTKCEKFIEVIKILTAHSIREDKKRPHP